MGSLFCEYLKLSPLVKPMIAKTELISWLLQSSGEFVGIDEGGLSLNCADFLGRASGAYFEIGGLPEVFDQDNQHPVFALEDWRAEAREGNTVLGYSEWVDSHLHE